MSPQAELQRVQLLFQHGELAQCEEAASAGANQFRVSNPKLAARFVILQALSASWRGKDKEVLKTLDDLVADPADSETYLKRLALLGATHADLKQFPEAEHELQLGQQFCSQQDNDACGWIIRSRASLARAKDRFSEAYELDQQGLEASRHFGIQLDEAISLMSLGDVCLQLEKYDESLDWSNAAIQMASPLEAREILQNTKGNLAWAYFRLGDSDTALSLLDEASKTAAALGDTIDTIIWLSASGYVHASREEVLAAKSAYDKAISIARESKSTEEQPNILSDLGLVALAAENAEEADNYAQQALSIARQGKSRPDIADALAVQMQAAALHGDTKRALGLLKEVEQMPESLAPMKWASEHALAALYERQGKAAQARNAYQTALLTFENARDTIRKTSSQLPFVANATAIYDDYIHFLITQQKPEEALLTADLSRARTLAQGLGADLGKQSIRAEVLSPQVVARKATATLLFYWLGEKQSYLWVISPRKTSLFPLPPQKKITPLVERYRKTLLGPTDPLQASDETALELYNILVAPAASLIPANGNVIILADGPLSLLNFETLLVPGKQDPGGIPSNPALRYWIEDVNVVSAPSLAMLAAARPSQRNDGKLLLLGDAISPDPSYPELPLASLEMRQIQKHFLIGSQISFSRQQANPSTYLTSSPQKYGYIHFVAHGVASRTDPLDSAIILSRAGTGEDGFKLYARDIMQHPIDARLVTISACYGSGIRSYVGEGLVGLSWAFLRAGAHNTIGALWEASDDSTPRLMDSLYQGIEQDLPPAAALRQAKLELLHSHSIFHKPFYWAPFQIYTRL